MADNPAPPFPSNRSQVQSWTSGAKDIVTTMLTGQVWATLGQGIVNEVFWPAVDQPQVKDFGFLVRAAEGPQWREVKAVGEYSVTPAQDPTVPPTTITHTGDFYELSFQAVPAPDVTIQLATGIQTFPLVSSMRTSKGRRPCLAAVER